MSQEVYADERLPLEVLPENLRRHVDPASPPPLRIAAAQALVPMAPGHLITALFMLRTDPDARIASTAQQSLDDLPPDVMKPALGERLDVRVLDYFARRFIRSPDYLDALIINAGVADETIHFIATQAKERQLELIASNQVRLLRHHRIIEALYFNSQTRMSTVDRVIDFAVRAGVFLTRIPAFNEAPAALGLEAPDTARPAPEIPIELEAAEPAEPIPEAPETEDDNLFAAYLEESLSEEAGEGLSDLEREFGGVSDAKAGEADDSGLDGYSAAKKEQKEEEDKRLGRGSQIAKMNISQKVRLALLGTKTDRGLLIRDTNRIVCMSVIKSPKVTPQEASNYAMLRSLNDEVIRYIAGKREWMKSYQVKMALVRNPKCPPGAALRLLPHLRKPDLRAVATDRNVANVVQSTAKQMIKGQRPKRR